MLVDEATISVESGRGGDGIVSWIREKFMPLGGPGGGDGGKGGDVILEAEPQLSTLVDFRYEPKHKADDGAQGGTSRKTGKDGEDSVIKVPVGTLVHDVGAKALLADLDTPGKRLLAVRGGRGGRGNQHFATATRQAPEIAERGEPSRERRLRLELRMIADVGVIGFPNVGKSTLISVVSAARPKIADYHFTTLQPNLGVVKLSGLDRSFVIADMPGLIVGAHQGAGLGDRFLRHISRTRLLIHVLDAATIEGRDPADDLAAINQELVLFSKELADIPQIVAFNKTDLPLGDEMAEMTGETLQEQGYECYAISAVTRQGVNELMEAVWRKLATMPRPEVEPDAEPETIVPPEEADQPLAILNDQPGVFVVTGTEVEYVAAVAYVATTDGLMRFHRTLARMDVLKALADAGAVEGDMIMIADLDFEYQPDLVS